MGPVPDIRNEFKSLERKFPHFHFVAIKKPITSNLRQIGRTLTQLADMGFEEEAEMISKGEMNIVDKIMKDIISKMNGETYTTGIYIDHYVLKKILESHIKQSDNIKEDDIKEDDIKAAISLFRKGGLTDHEMFIYIRGIARKHY